MNSHPPVDRTLRALQRHLAALPCTCYELRLIDNSSRQCRASRWWTGGQLLVPHLLAFLRARNRADCDIYFRPYQGDWNAGYVLLDFDAAPCPLTRMRAAGQTPCVVVETSPGRQQAWVRIGPSPALPAQATALARRLAQAYGADPASADWRHLGRLAGFTNRKPQRQTEAGQPPYVKVVWTGPGDLVMAEPEWDQPVSVPAPQVPGDSGSDEGSQHFPEPGEYARCLPRAGVWMPVTDWSVADYRVARALLAHGLSPARVMAVLRSGSPGFPRRHADPDGYLRRTVTRAAAELQRALPFSSAPTK